MNRRIHHLQAAAVLALVALMLTASGALGLTWGNTKQVSGTDSGNAWDTAIAAYGNSVFIAYREYDGETRQVMFRRSTDGGTTLTDPVAVNRPEATQSSQASLAYSGGVLHLAWVDGGFDGDQERGWYRRSLDGGTTWTDPELMTPSQVEVVSSPRVFASGNRVFYTFTDGTTGSIHIRRSTDGGKDWAIKADSRHLLQRGLRRLGPVRRPCVDGLW